MGRRKLASTITAAIRDTLLTTAKHQGTSEATIATTANLSRSAIHNALRGDGGITLDAFIGICAALNLDPVRVLRSALSAA